jgi:antitoxin MazE
LAANVDQSPGGIYYGYPEGAVETRIARWGNSQGVRLPREALEQAGLAVGDAVRVGVEDGRVTLEKVRRVRGRYRLEDLIARMPLGAAEM